MYKVTKRITVFIALCINLLQAQAGDGLPVIARDTIDPLMELMKVRNYHIYNSDANPYSGIPYRYIVQKYENNILQSSDTMQMVWRVKGETYAFTIDNKMEYVQDEIYNAAVYLEDSVIYVSKPQNIDPVIFQVDIFNPSFYNQIDSTSITDSLYIFGFSRKISLKFNPTSSYMDYFIKFVNYTPHFYVIGVEYRTKDEIVPAEQPVTSYTRVSIQLAITYSGPPTQQDTFSTKRFFKQENGVFVPVAPYTDFRIIDATKQ